jgi:D-glycero-alpha-D-manno-heptose 1-phosphate guanylyltransferase
MNSLSGIVLVGGLGTRLRSVFLSGPKSMAPVANRPFLEYLLSKLKVDGITDVVLCVGYRRTQVQDYFHRGTKWGLELRYSVEQELLGNAGAVKKAACMISSAAPFVFNGDSFLSLDVAAMWDFHHSRKALATVAMVSSPRANRYDRILTNEEGEITAFRERDDHSVDDDNDECLINAGTYLLSRRFIDLIPDGRPVSIEKEMFPKLVGSGLYGFFTDGRFIDIGVPEDMDRAQNELSIMRSRA